MTFVEGVPPSKHFRCITQRYVLRSPITQPNIPEEQVAIPQAFSSPEKAWLREANPFPGGRGLGTRLDSASLGPRPSRDSRTKEDLSLVEGRGLGTKLLLCSYTLVP